MRLGIRNNILRTPLEEIFKTHRVQEFRNSIVDQSFKYCNTMCGKSWNLDQVETIPTQSLRLPTTIYLQIDKNCNLKCGSCRTTNIYSPNVDPTVEQILNKLIDTYQNFDQPVLVYCDGVGDIFASAAYQQFLRNPQLPSCFKFGFTTNGNLVTKNMDLLQSLHQRNQIEKVVVSFDAATSETYKEVRGGNFNLVLEGVKQMRKHNILVAASYVVQYKNYLEILDYVKLCKNLDVNHTGLTAVNRFPHMTDSHWNETRLDNNPSVDQEFLVNALLAIKQESNCEICGSLEAILSLAKSNPF